MGTPSTASSSSRAGARRVELEPDVGAAGGDGPHHEPVAVVLHRHRGHLRGVVAVEADGDAQEPGQAAHEVPGPRRRAPANSGCFGLRLRLAVVAGHERDALDLVVGEAGQPVGAADDVVAVLVVLRVGQEQPDVAQEGGRLEDLAGVVAEAVAARRWRRTGRGRGGPPGPSGRGPRPSAARGRRTLRRRRSDRWWSEPPWRRCQASSSTPSRSA